ncbi:MAG: hypothetical protein M3N23_08260 [Pseudomonadota bacterium]|nr:hypothetical protein [Pseudomonadota bacterium]
MITFLRSAERRARHFMTVSAVLMALTLGATQAGWITRSAAYSLQSWYLIDNAEHFTITREFQDKASCLKKQHDAVTCKSGAVMMAAALAAQKPASQP